MEWSNEVVVCTRPDGSEFLQSDWFECRSCSDRILVTDGAQLKRIAEGTRVRCTTCDPDMGILSIQRADKDYKGVLFTPGAPDTG